MVSIVTGSASDIPHDVARELGITIIPLLVHFGVEAYEDGIDLGMEQFYRKLENSQNFPKTAAPGPSIFTEAVDVTPVIGAHTGPHILMAGVLEGEE